MDDLHTQSDSSAPKRYYTFTSYSPSSEYSKDGFTFDTSPTFGPLPAYVFFLGERRELTLTDVLPALRELHGPGTSVRYRAATMYNGYPCLLVTTAMRLPTPTDVMRGNPDAASDTWVADIHADVLEEQDVDYRELYRWRCTEIEGLSGACPCELQWRNSEHGVNVCAERLVAPYVGVVPVETLLRRRALGMTIPERTKDARTIGGFEYLPSRLLTTESPFSPRHLGIKRLDPTAIEHNKKRISQGAKDAASTRKQRVVQCTPCFFRQPNQTSACNRYHMSRCSGPKTEADVRRDVRQAVELAAFHTPGFTPEQRSLLIWNAGEELSARIPAFSPRPTRISIGSFVQQHSMAGAPWVAQIFAACSDKSRAQYFASWDELVAAVPAVLELVRPQYKPDLTQEHLDLYALIAKHKRWVEVRSMRGKTTRALKYIGVSSTGVAGHYGGSWGASGYSECSLHIGDVRGAFDVAYGTTAYAWVVHEEDSP